jgi:hypothetical protein
VYAGQAWVSAGMDDRSISNKGGFREGSWEKPSLQTRTDPVRADSQHARKPSQLNGSPRLPLVVGGFYWSDPDRLLLYVWEFTSITRRLWFRPSDGSALALAFRLAGAMGWAGAIGLAGRLGAQGGVGVLQRGDVIGCYDAVVLVLWKAWCGWGRLN